MIELMAEVPTQDGRMNAFVTRPEQGGPFAAIVILMDVWGLREELFDIARKVAVTGYYCIVPNFYYRQGLISFEFRDERGQAGAERRNRILPRRPLCPASVGILSR
jgi:carboxymethylenebutenolidase